MVVALEVSTSENDTLKIWVIVNHFKSKRADTSTQEYTLPRRIQQTQFVTDLVEHMENTFPGAGILILGDLNDYPDSEPLAILQQTGLWNSLSGVERAARCTYIYQGLSQVLDYVLLNPSLAINWADTQPVHINADFPYIYRGFDCISTGLLITIPFWWSTRSCPIRLIYP